MEDKIKIQNKTKHVVGITYANGVQKAIIPKQILPMTKDEFEFVASSSKLFANKHLTVLTEGALESVGINPDEVAYVEDEAIVNKLIKSNIKGFTKYLEGVTLQHERFRIVELIKEKGLMSQLTAEKVNKLNSIFEVDLNADLGDEKSKE